jgi:hypothetical protein
METRERLRNEQVAQVVAEVTRLQQQRADFEAASLSRAQVEEILQELNLPTDLIDDALAQLQRKESLAREQRRKKLMIAGGALAVLILIAAFFWWSAQRNATFARINADTGRITRTADNGGNLSTVTRNGEDVVYHVTLHDAPPGERLSLSCNWIAPNGQVFKQNQWQTREIDQPVWPTSCKCQIGAAAEKGTWKVEMKLGDRVLSSTAFQVE